MDRYQFFFMNKFLSNTKLMLAVASKNCNPMEIRKLISEDPSMLNQTNIVGDTPLHYAISFGHSVENVEELLKQGARVNDDRFQTSPLHAAVCRNTEDQYAVLKILLEYGGHVNKRDFIDHTPLHILLKTMKKSFQERSLHLLLSNGADVNALDSENISPLKVALMNSSISSNAIKMLLEFGANANDCIGYSVTTLPLAELLLQYILIKRIGNNNYSLFSPKKILDLKFCEDLRYYQELVTYRDECIKELVAMKEEKISKSYSYFSFINDRCSTPKVNEEDLRTSLTNKVLLKFEQYPYCKDLIIASLKERCILNELCHTNIYAWKHIPEISLKKCKVSLNGDTIQALATFLIKSDLINLILAYRDNHDKECRHIFKGSSRSTKRISRESADYDQPIKHSKI